MENASLDSQSGIHEKSRIAGTSLLAAGGLAAAFAAASCCALPIVLGVVGLSSAWLGGVADMAMPWQPWLLWGGLISLAFSALVMFRQSTTCNSSSLCATPGFRWGVGTMILAGFGLAGMVFWVG